MTHACPVVDQDLTDWAFGQDPYPAIEEWRKLGPVVYHERYDEYIVTGYRDCAQALTQVDRFSSQDLQEQFIRIFGGVTMEALDTPRHHAMRGVWAGSFGRRALEAQRELIAEVVASQVGPFAERVRSGAVIDAIPAMTRAIPTLVIARMIGIDESMHGQFSAWSDAMGQTQLGTYDPTPAGRELIERGMRGTAALNAYMAEIVKQRRAQERRDDLVSAMVHDAFAKSEMSEQEIVASNSQLVFAGNETTAKLMATILVALAKHPDQRRALAADRSLIPRAVEEIHRWETVVQVLPRRVISDEARVSGIRIPRGASVRLLIAAGNRDPDRWTDAGKLDIFREQRQHLGFGFGMHVCLGINLARLELQIWLDQFLDQLPEYELAEVIEYPRGIGLRGPLAVPIAR
jgi:cytochrome P450